AKPAMHCSYYQSGRCRSCSWLPLAYARQLQDKQQHCRGLLGALGPEQWLPTVPSSPQGFRNKAKMAVGGSPQQPTLGTLDSEYIGVDLRDCPLYPPALAAAFAPAAQFLARASVAPYDVRARTGEAKFLLATVADHSGELMLRFVLRSTEAVQRMQREVPWLQAQLP